MSRWLPSPAEERWLALGERYPAWRDAAQSPERAGDWKTATPRTRIGFFLLGLFIGSQAQTLVVLLLGLPWSNSSLGLGLGLLTLLVAELLTVRRRLFHSGLEEGLWLAGIVSICSALLPRLFEPLAAIALWVPAGLLVLAGLRQLNPLAVTTGFLVSTAALAFWLDPSLRAQDTVLVSLYCMALALSALIAGGLRLARPSHDDMLDQLVIVMPVAGYVWSLLGSREAGLATVLPVLLPLVTATVYCIVGLLRRSHAPLFGMIACKLCLAWELRELTSLPWRWKLVGWGTLALLAGLGLDRWLRTPRAGFTTANVGDDQATSLVPDVAQASALTPLQPPTSPAPYGGEGGGFGGGGASGRY